MRVRLDRFDMSDPNGSFVTLDQTYEDPSPDDPRSGVWDVSTHDEEDGFGFGEFKVNRNDPFRVDELVEPNSTPTAIVKCRLEDDGDSEPRPYYFGFFIETTDDIIAPEQESGGEVYRRGGRGFLSYLERAVIHGDEEDGNRHWDSATVGSILIELLDEAIARGSLQHLTYDFDATDDSASNPWAVAADDFQLPVLMYYTDVIAKLRALNVKFRMSPDFVLSAWQDKVVPDKTATVEFRLGDNIRESAGHTVVAKAGKSNVIVQGATEDGVLKYETVVASWEDPDDIREGGFQYQATPESARLIRAGQAYLNAGRFLRDGPTSVGVTVGGQGYDDLEDPLAGPHYVPYDDYEPGDKVTVDLQDAFDFALPVIDAITIVQTVADEIDAIISFQANELDPILAAAKMEVPESLVVTRNVCCPPDGPFVPNPTEDCGIAAQATLHTFSIPDHDSTVIQGLTPAGTLVNGQQYRMVVDVIYRLIIPLGDGQCYAGMAATICVAGGGSSPISPDNGAWTDIDPGPLNPDTFAVPGEAGAHYEGPWGTWDSTDTDFDLFAGGSVLSGFYGAEGSYLLTVETRNGDGSPIDCDDDPSVPSEGQTVIEQSTVTGVDQVATYPFLPGSLHVHVGGVLVPIVVVDAATGEYTLPFDPGGHQVVLHYQAASGTPTGAISAPPSGGVDLIPTELLPANPITHAAHIIYSRDYGVTADGTTDDTAARQAAIDAAAAAAIAGSGLAVVRHPWGIIQHAGALVTSGNYYAQVTLPERAGNASKIAIIEEPEGWEGNVLFPGGLQSVSVDSPVIFRSTLTGQSYSGTHGWPSITGGPDPEKTSTFTNLLYHARGIVVRAPANPTVCGFNLQLLNQARIEDMYFDTSDTITGGITQPTAPTGVAVLMPREGHNALNEYRGNVWAVGWYGGPSVSEHTRVDSIATYRCVVGTPVQGNYYHSFVIQNLSTEHCTYGLAYIDPTSGPSSPTGASGFSAGVIVNWKTEHATSGWAEVVADIYDPDDRFYIDINNIVITAGVGNPTPPQALTLNGAAHCTIRYLLNGPTSAGVTDHDDLTGLGDDDHTQYVLRSILTTRGDLFRRGAAAIERVALGTSGQVWTSDGTDAVWDDPTGSGRWELAVIPGSPPDPLYADGDYLYIFVP